jgi:serine/threonine-protein kinase
MKKRKNGTEVDAFVNGQRFARKELIGLDGRVGKVALGCRNLHCDFDDLKVRGKFAPAPQSKVAEARPE